MFMPGFIPMITPGTQSFTGNGTFTVPAYTTMTVTAHGAHGGSATEPAICGGSTFQGGVGGKVVKTFTAGAAGSPTVGGSVTVQFTAGAVKFNSSTPVSATNGQDAYGGATDGGADPICLAQGSAGSDGGGSGGTVTVGGSGYNGGYLVIEWT